MRKNLIAKREQKKLTQAETAKAIGITTRQYINLEAGTSDGSVKVWQKLKDLFKTSIDTLLENTTKNGGLKDASKANGRGDSCIKEDNRRQGNGAARV